MNFTNYLSLDNINESFDINEIYFKIMPLLDFEKVKKDGFLSPVGKVYKNQKLYKGNWSIPLSNLKNWIIKVKYFGSPIQALLMKAAPMEKELVLLHLKLGVNNKIYNRDISKMFVKPSFKGYFSSFSNENEYEINESFLTGIINKYEIINIFKVPKKLAGYRAEPNSVLDFIYGKGDIIYTKKKMTPIKRAFMYVILKKIFTLDFKDF